MEDNILMDTCIQTTFDSDNYQLLTKIGQGGFGQVYKAIQTSTQQIVAIKFLTLDDNFTVEKKRRYIDRFHRESDLVRRLNHPNIVHLIDKGQQSDNLLFAVYEYIDGHSLKHRLETQGPLGATEAAEVMACVLDALSHAHEQGVIHRDIKPANIMLYQVGAKTHVKVLDFGIGTLKNEARQLDYKSITLTQETLGTPSYSAPEQLRGEPPVAQTDIYVWGLVFIECLTATPTITGRSLAAIFHQQLSPANVPLGILAGHSSANFFRRVLNKKSQERPRNTAELYHDFRQLNFANLVGDLSVIPDFIQHNLPANAKVEKNVDETLIHEARYSYSRLTERKQISVLSIILSTDAIPTEQTTTHSPEQIIDQDVIDTFHADQMQQCIDIAVRYGAYHVGNLGDTLLFYFGYPHVTDNDSRLCSRAALEITSNVNKKNSLLKSSQGITSHIQMGMQIGLMLSLADSLPDGKAAHDAMSLCRQAIPGQILCSENVKHILEGYLNFEGIMKESHEIEALPRKIQALYQLRGERHAEAFGFLRGTRKNRAFIGRQHELTTLVNLNNKNINNNIVLNITKDKNDLAQTKQAKLAHIYGEAGIGKSRLVFELREKLPEALHLVAQCLPEHKNNALYPILNLLKFKFSLDALSAKHCITRLKQAIERTSLATEHKSQGLEVLCAWLNLPIDDNDLVRTNAMGHLSPDIQKQRLFTTLSHLFCQTALSVEGTAHNKQHLFIFEDMHWADPTSKEFINYIINTKIFLQGQHSWINTSREPLPVILTENTFNNLALKKLSHSDTTNFIAYLFDQQPLASRLTQLLIERTDGIPLFIEELASTLQNQKLVHKVNGIIDFVNNDKQSQVPVTLRDSLQQKLDGLSFAKETAQLAAAIGREFDYKLLVTASNKSEEQIQADLKELIINELIYLQRQVGVDAYIFKHALVRDAAYESLTPADSEKIHLQVAISLAQEAMQDSNKSMSVIAQHFYLAKQYQQASEYGLKGVQQQVSHSANDEALVNAAEVLTWCKEIKDPAVSHELEMQLLEAQIAPVLSADGYGGERVDHITSRIPQLVEQLTALTPDKNINLRTNIKNKSDWVLFLNLFYESQREKAGSLARKMIAEAIQQNDIQRQMVISMMLAEVYFFDGEIDNALILHEEAITLWDPKRDKNCYQEYGIEPNVQNLAMGAMYYLHHGDINTAAKRLQQAEACITDELDDISRVFVYLFQAINAMHLNDMQQIKDSMHAYDDKYGQGTSVVHHTVYLSALYAFATDDFELGNEKTNIIKQSEQNISTARWCTFLAKLYMKHQHFDEAIARFRHSFSIAKNNNTFIWFAYIKTTLAKCLFLKAHKENKNNAFNDEIKQLLIDAIELAWRQNSRWSALEALHALKSMAPELMTPDYQDKLTSLTQFMNERGLKSVAYKPDFQY